MAQSTRRPFLCRVLALTSHLLYSLVQHRISHCSVTPAVNTGAQPSNTAWSPESVKACSHHPCTATPDTLAYTLHLFSITSATTSFRRPIALLALPYSTHTLSTSSANTELSWSSLYIPDSYALVLSLSSYPPLARTVRKPVQSTSLRCACMHQHRVVHACST